ncbi:MAG: hemerythrin domain-containing protein [Melioribacteraceae bacterium]
MYQTEKYYIKAGMKISDLIFDNPSLLLLLENLELDFISGERTIEQVCHEKNISAAVFVSIANLFNGFYPTGEEQFNSADIPTIIKYLKNAHNYYENEKYPEIRNCIEELYKENNSPEIQLIGKFFDEYFNEVKEHLAYEDKVAFPYFYKLYNSSASHSHDKANEKYSSNEYHDHHSDIESKLTDLKELLLKHIPVKNDRIIRRKIFISLSDLEHDLNIHSTIEETILIPIVSQLEKKID